MKAKKNDKIRLSLLMIFFGIIFLFQSCGQNVVETIDGVWTIDTLIYEELDSRICLFSNVLIFDEKNVSLPITGDRCEGLSIYDDKGTWSLIRLDSIPLQINIRSKNPMFSGNHQIVFFGDDKYKLLKMRIISDHLYMVASKTLFNYDRNIDLINDLIEQSSSK